MIAPTEKAFRSHGAELLQDLADNVKAILMEIVEMPADKADQVGMEIANRMSDNWRGQIIYFPAGLSAKIHTRDLQIWDEFTGNNHSQLAKKYEVSLQWVYKIVKTMREMDRSQSELFEKNEIK